MKVEIIIIIIIIIIMIIIIIIIILSAWSTQSSIAINPLPALLHGR